MAINPFNVTYSDFQLDQIIHPDEFDVNFADVEVRMNQAIDVLNQITDGIGGHGSDIIDIRDALPFDSQTLQEFIDDILEKLQSTTSEESGSEFIGSATIIGLAGNTVREQMLSLNTKIDDLSTHVDSEVERIDNLIASNSLAIDNLDARVTVNEADIATKANASDVYTRTEVDVKDASDREYVNNNFYTTTEVDDNFTPIDGDHEGTWNGVAQQDLFSVMGVNETIVSTTEPSNPENKTLWYNPSDGMYRLWINGQWRVSGTSMKIVKAHKRVTLDADASSVTHGITQFDPELDAVSVSQNSVNIFEGYEYNLSTNGSAIEHPDGVWEAGTVFDFEAFISTPV